MSGYKVILDAGIHGRTVEFPDANCWCFYKGYLKVGDGSTNHIGDFEGDRHGTFVKDKVAGVVEL